MNEIWKDIPGYEGLYSISNFGRIKSHPKKSGFLIKKETILNPYTKANGYLQVDLTVEGKRKKFYVHRLVALVFIPNPDNLATVNHIDKNRTNNNVENLEWASYSDNNAHGECQIIAGLARRIPILQCDLDGTIIKEWECGKLAADTLGFSAPAITKCCKRKAKTHKGYIWKYKS